MKKVCIKGDGTEETGKRIIEYLEGLGGVNDYIMTGTEEAFYFINSKNEIEWDIELPSGYELITIPELIPGKTFPREMWVWDDDKQSERLLIVDGMYKDRYVVIHEYSRKWVIYKHAIEIEPPKPLTTDEKIADLQRQIDELKNGME